MEESRHSPVDNVWTELERQWYHYIYYYDDIVLFDFGTVMKVDSSH